MVWSSLPKSVGLSILVEIGCSHYVICDESLIVTDCVAGALLVGSKDGKCMYSCAYGKKG